VVRRDECNAAAGRDGLEHETETAIDGLDGGYCGGD
jgi:hypothetical protein